MAATTFDSTKEFLHDMLKSISDAKTQLPDFQRHWIWDDDHILSLLASISLSYPIGAIMILQAGNPSVRLKPRFIEGVTLSKSCDPERLILDGQQRLTSLYQSLEYGLPVETLDSNKKPIKRWYYIDMLKSLDPSADREESIIGLPEDRKLRNFRGEVSFDYSSSDLEYEGHLFPLAKVFDCSEWRRGFNTHWRHDSDKTKLFDAFEAEIIKRFERYELPLIILRKETPKIAVCQVFEKVNTGGVSLTVFELLAATFAIDNFSLRDDWRERQTKIGLNEIFSGLESDQFLQAISLVSTFERRKAYIDAHDSIDGAPGISCKRSAILNLSLSEYTRWSESVTNAFEKVAKFLFGQKIFDARDLPYRTQIVPLAAIYAILGEKSEPAGVSERLANWFWAGVLGELYSGATESRFARDVPEVLDWLNGKAEPTTVTEASFNPDRLLTLQTRGSAAYKGIYALLLRDGCLDFRSGEEATSQRYFDENIDIHHIFPKKWCEDNGIDKARWNSIVNKTPLSAKTNRMISGDAPSIYMGRLVISAGVDAATISSFLASHLIDVSQLEENNFDSFFESRKSMLLNRIQEAMGKPIFNDLFDDQRLQTAIYNP